MSLLQNIFINEYNILSKMISTSEICFPGLSRKRKQQYNLEKTFSPIETNNDEHNSTTTIIDITPKEYIVQPIEYYMGYPRMETELERFYKAENSQRETSVISLTYESLNNLYDIYQTDTDEEEYYTVDFMREMVVSCGIIQLHTEIFIPGCSLDNCCIGYSGMIEGISHDIKGVKLRAFFTPHEWSYIKKGKIYDSQLNKYIPLTQENINQLCASRKCILDIIKEFTISDIQKISNQNKIQIVEITNPFNNKFLFDKENGYKSEYSNNDIYPNINLSNILFYFRYDINLWSLDMRTIEYDPKPLLGNNTCNNKVWSVDNEIWKLTQNNNNNRNHILDSQIYLLKQMKGNNALPLYKSITLYNNINYTTNNNNNNNNDYYIQ